MYCNSYNTIKLAHEWLKSIKKTPWYLFLSCQEYLPCTNYNTYLMFQWSFSVLQIIDAENVVWRDIDYFFLLSCWRKLFCNSDIFFLQFSKKKKNQIISTNLKKKTKSHIFHFCKLHQCHFKNSHQNKKYFYWI